MNRYQRPYTDNADIWKKDYVTRTYLREKGDALNAPSKMTKDALTDAVTYCAQIDNPYTHEIIKRNNMQKQYEEARGAAAKNLVLKKACLQWGYHLDGYGLGKSNNGK